jgi:regulatory protein
VSLDTGASFRLRPDDVAALGLSPGAEVDAAVLQAVQERSLRLAAGEAARRLLSVRPRSEKELRDRLRRRGIPEPVVAAVIADLRAQGWVDDRRFADAWVRDRIALRPSGRLRLRHELTRRGVSREVVEATLADALPPSEELALAREVASARAGRYRDLPAPTAARRLAGVLLRRGFAAPVVARVLQDLFGHPGEPS